MDRLSSLSALLLLLFSFGTLTDSIAQGFPPDQEVTVCVDFTGTEIEGEEHAATQMAVIGLLRRQFNAINQPTARINAYRKSDVEKDPSRKCELLILFREIRANDGSKFGGYAFKDNQACVIDKAKILERIKMGGPQNNLQARLARAVAEIMAHEVGHLLCAEHQCQGGGSKPGGCTGAERIMSDGRCIRPERLGLLPTDPNRIQWADNGPAWRKNVRALVKAFKKVAEGQAVDWGNRVANFNGRIITVEGGQHNEFSVDSLGNVFEAIDPNIDFDFAIFGDTSTFQWGWLNLNGGFVPYIDDSTDVGVLSAVPGTGLEMAVMGKAGTPFEDSIYLQSTDASTTFSGYVFTPSDAATPGIAGNYFSRANIQFNIGGNPFSILLNTEPWSEDNGFQLYQSACGANQRPVSILTESGMFPAEIQWFLINSSTGDTVGSRSCDTTSSVSEQNFCLTEGEDYLLVLQDDWGDGWDEGSIRVYDPISGCNLLRVTPSNGMDGDFTGGCSGYDTELIFAFTASDSITGCTDVAAVNFNPCAVVDDGSCEFPPANTICALSRRIFCGESVDGSTLQTPADPSIPFCVTGLNSAPAVWYSFIANGGDVSFDICNADFDTKIGVFTGACDSLICVTGNDDFCGLQSQVSIFTQPGQRYYICVTGFGNERGNFTLTTQCFNPPTTDLILDTILVQQLDEDLFEVQPIVTVVHSQGNLPLSYYLAVNSAIVDTIGNLGIQVTQCAGPAGSCGGIFLIDGIPADTLPGGCDPNSRCVVNLALPPTVVQAGRIDFVEIAIDFADQVIEQDERNNVRVQFFANSTCLIPDSLRSEVTSISSVTLDWSDVPLAIGYELRGGLLGLPPIAPIQLGTASSFSVANLTPGASYYWQVRPICGPGQSSPWSRIDTFSFNCPVPGNLNSTVSGSNVTLAWDPPPNSIGYIIQGGPLSSPTAATLQIPGGAIGSFQVNNLAPATYVWRIRSVCSLSPFVASPFSAQVQFTITAKQPSILSSSIGSPKIDVRLIPNPASTYIELQLTGTASDATYHITLYDLPGNRLMRQNLQGHEGFTRTVIDVERLAAGWYLMVVESDGVREVLKVVVE